MNYFNEAAIEKLKEEAQIAPAGFRYGFVEGIFKNETFGQLVGNFPPVSSFKLVDKMSGGGRKKFYVGPNYYSGRHRGSIAHLTELPAIWIAVLRESASPEFIERLRWATGIKFNSLCNFGFSYGSEGCMQGAHIDGAARPSDPSSVHSTIACLLYFNPGPGGSTGTCIYQPDRETIIFQVPNLRNSMSFFEQHPAAWHGFPTVPAGEERRIISLSYSQEADPILIKKNETAVPTLSELISHFLSGRGFR